MTPIELAAKEAAIQYISSALDSPHEPKASQALGLALRRVLLTWLCDERPRLIERVTKEGVYCYGGAALLRSGRSVKLQCLPGQKPSSLFRSLGMHDIGQQLLGWSQSAIRKAYGDRLTTLVESFLADLPPALVPRWQQASKLQTQFRGHLEWVLDGRMSVRWWGGKQVTASMLSKLVLKHAWDQGLLNREVWGLTIRICGMHPLLIHYNAVARHLTAVRARITEAPNLAPLLLESAPRIRPSEAKLAFDQEALARHRDALLAAGATPAGWRWLCKQSRQWVMLIHRGHSLEERAELISLMAAHQVGRLPLGLVEPFQLTAWVTGTPYRARLDKPERQRSMARLLKLLAHDVAKRRLKVRDIRGRLPEVLDFIDAGHPLEKGATWQSLWRRQEAWHVAMHRQRIAEIKAHREQQTAYAWTPLVPELEHNGVRAVSLTTSDELWAEGDRLEHCVGTYAPQCYANESRIFAMRTPEDEPLATLEVRYYRGNWLVAQLRGRRNQPVESADIQALAKMVVTAVRGVPIPPVTENQVVRAGVPGVPGDGPANAIFLDFLDARP